MESKNDDSFGTEQWLQIGACLLVLLAFGLSIAAGEQRRRNSPWVEAGGGLWKMEVEGGWMYSHNPHGLWPHLTFVSAPIEER